MSVIVAFGCLVGLAGMTQTPQIVEIKEASLTNIIEQPFSLQDADLLATQNLINTYTCLKKQLIAKFGPEIANELLRFESLARISHKNSPKGCEKCELDIVKKSLSEIGRKAALHTFSVYEELIVGSYTPQSARAILRWATELLCNHLSGGATEIAKKVHQIREELLSSESYTFTLRSSEEIGHSNAWLMTPKACRDDAPSFLLKESAEVPLPANIEVKYLDESSVKIPLHVKRFHPLCFSSFLKLLPEMPLTTKINEHERIGYEQDALFGFGRTPMTFQVRFFAADEKGQNKQLEGSIQLFVKDGKPGGSTFLYEKQRAQELLTLDASCVQLAVISGLFKGITAGHMDNYLFRVSDKSVSDVLEIDLEEIMPPFNRIPATITPSFALALAEQKKALEQLPQDAETKEQIAAIDQKIDSMRKAIILCRMWILGLPQAQKPFDRACLLALTHPSFSALLTAYHVKAALQGELHPDTLTAQKERFEKLQQMSRDELAKTEITATPRDFFFSIFGGRELYWLAKEKQFPDIVAFTQVVSDPYNYTIKDFSQPEKMASSTLLAPICDGDSKERKIVKENAQLLEHAQMKYTQVN
jgi:hypothetical protein